MQSMPAAACIVDEPPTKALFVGDVDTLVYGGGACVCDAVDADTVAGGEACAMGGRRPSWVRGGDSCGRLDGYCCRCSALTCMLWILSFLLHFSSSHHPVSVALICRSLLFLIVLHYTPLAFILTVASLHSSVIRYHVSPSLFTFSFTFSFSLLFRLM